MAATRAAERSVGLNTVLWARVQVSQVRSVPSSLLVRAVCLWRNNKDHAQALSMSKAWLQGWLCHPIRMRALSSRTGSMECMRWLADGVGWVPVAT